MKDKEARQRIEQEEVGNMAIAERLVKLQNSAWFDGI